MNQRATHRRQESVLAVLFSIIGVVCGADFALPALGQVCDPAWDVSIGNPGLDDYSFDMEVFDDGSGPALYVCGRFESAGGMPIAGIARWDGREWSDVGGSLTAGGWMGGLFVFDDGTGEALYAGGRFSEVGGVKARNIAKWDGETWSSLGEGVDDMVWTFGVFDDGRGRALYAGGSFRNAGGAPANNVARWDGSDWEALDDGMHGGSSFGILALEVFDDGSGPALYAAGDANLYIPEANRWIGRWTGSEWQAAPKIDFRGGGGNCVKHIDSLLAYDDGSGMALYIGGVFEVVDVAVNLVKWDGAEVVPVGSSIEDVGCAGVFDLKEFDLGFGPRLYASGRLWIEDHSNVVLAEWDGSDWTALGFATSGGWTEYLELFDDGRGAGPSIYVTGDYPEINGDATNNLARWGVPDLQLSVDPLIAGQRATIVSTCAGANKNVYFIASMSGLGTLFVPQLNVTIDLDQPMLIATVRADGSGEASFGRRVPEGMKGRSIWLQAAQVGRVSRVKMQVVQ